MRSLRIYIARRGALLNTEFGSNCTIRDFEVTVGLWPAIQKYRQFADRLREYETRFTRGHYGPATRFDFVRPFDTMDLYRDTYSTVNTFPFLLWQMKAKGHEENSKLSVNPFDRNVIASTVNFPM